MSVYGFILVGLLAALAVGGEEIRVTEVVSVHDGDTFTVNLSCEEAVFCEHISVRLKGINTAEITSADPAEKAQAIAARAALSSLVVPAHDVRLLDITRDKYFRLNARVVADGVDVGQQLLDRGLAKPYTGAGPKRW